MWDGRIKADARSLPIGRETVQCVVTSPPYWGLRDYKQDGQIGLERTPREYLNSIREVAFEIWRVLKLDGTFWLNLGDCYHSGNRGGYHRYRAGVSKNMGHSGNYNDFWLAPNRTPQNGIKDKDLVGIPWRVALALQEDGWYLRSDIIWHKPNPMPESVTDRPTRAHEYIFLLTKSERYFYDHEAIKEPATFASPNSPESIASPYGQGFTRRANKWDEAESDKGHAANHVSGGVLRKQEGHGRRHAGFNDRWDEGEDSRALTRNKRSVWTISTQPYPEAHYATFPEEIPELCIKAGSKPGDLILDPFFGSGTVGRVAERLNRRWIGCDLGYQDLQSKRLMNVQKELSWSIG